MVTLTKSRSWRFLVTPAKAPFMSAETNRLLKVATVAAAHGIRGEVRLKVFLEDMDTFKTLGPFVNISGAAIGAVDIRGKSKEQFIARVDGANTRDAAEALKGLNFFVPRDRLPEPEEEDEFYYEDLKNLRVLEDGTDIGHIKSVRDHGAGDLVEIEFPNGKTDYFAFSKANFPEVKVAAGHVTFVRPAETISQDEDGKVH